MGPMKLAINEGTGQDYYKNQIIAIISCNQNWMSIFKKNNP